MNVEKLKNEVSKRLPLRRFEHVLSVVETAKKLAEHYEVDVEKVELAAYLHDIAKFMEQEKLREIIVKENGDQRILSFHTELWHGPAGAEIARDEFNIQDEDILNAIRYHTTGRANMSAIEKIIYIADLIEPGRKFTGSDRLREIATENLDDAMGACVQHSLQFLLSKSVAIYPDSLECYNEHMKKG